MYFTIYRDVANGWRWTLYAANNRKIADSGEAYVEKAGAPGAAHSVALYLDDYASGITVTNNIVKDPGTHGLQAHGGSNISVHNNIFDLGTGTTSTILFQGVNTNAPQNVSVFQNIIESAAPVQKLWDLIDQTSLPSITNNLYWNTVGGLMQSSAPLQDTNPHFGDPKFANPAAGNYALGAGSAAGAIGFQQIDQSQIGLKPTTAHWYA